MVIGFTGTQHGMNPRQEEMFIKVLEGLIPYGNTFVHGDCIGSDLQAHIAAWHYPLAIVIYPPEIRFKRSFSHNKIGEIISSETTNDLILRYVYKGGRIVYIHDPAPYLMRDSMIVKVSDVLIATPGQKTEMIRSGTWYTIRQARKKGIPIWKIYPDTTVETENKESMSQQLPIRNLTLQGDGIWI